MSVTIVTATPKAAQTADTASNNAANIDTTGNGADFASLLKGQLTPTDADALPETLVKTEHDALIDNAAPADAAALLAALGHIPAELGRNTATIETGDASLQNISKADKSSLDTLPGLQSTAATGSALKTEVTAETVKADPRLTGATTADDKAAKFAVTPETEAVMSKTASADALPNHVTALTTAMPANTNGIRDNTFSVTTPVRDQSWAGDFAQKIVWMAGNNKQAAQLTLNPPQMGPIEISLNMDKGNATATFVSANADVRDAIETALPRLREMFASAGISLGQTNVSAESFSQQGSNREGNLSASQWMSDNAILGADATGSLTSRAFSTRQGNGLVDIFA